MGLTVNDRSAVFALGRLKTETVEIDDSTITLSEIGAIDSYDLFTNPIYQGKDGGMNMASFAPALLVRSIVDADGNRIFSDDDAAGLSRMPVALFNTLSTAAMRVNGLTSDFQDNEIKN